MTSGNIEYRLHGHILRNGSSHKEDDSVLCFGDDHYGPAVIVDTTCLQYGDAGTEPNGEPYYLGGMGDFKMSMKDLR